MMKVNSNSDLLISPVITEKTTLLQERGKYTFKVSKEATKTQIKDAVTEIFNVKVSSVNILNKKGKPKTFGRNKVITPGSKRAIVTLVSGETINITEGT
jgi:large subunit ribosomal protein L23